MSGTIQAIKEEVEKVNAVIETSRNSKEKTIFLQEGIQKQYILSKYNPKSSVCKLIEGQSFNPQTLWIIVGFMFGYPIEEIVKSVGQEAKIIVVEPNIDLLKRELEGFENEKFLGCKYINVLGGIAFDELLNLYEEFIDASNYNNLNVVVPAAYKKMYPLFYQKLIEIIANVSP